MALISSLHDARKAVSRPDAQSVSDRLAMLDGDHWLNGRGWAGPKVEPGNPDYSVIMAAVADGFVSSNKLAEVVGRHTAAVAGREVRLTIEPRRPVSEEAPLTPDEEALVGEADAILLEWFDQRRALQVIQNAARYALTAGSTCLRLYVPAGLLIDGAIEAASADQAASLVYAEALNPLSATVAVDPLTKHETAVFVFTHPETKRQAAEISEVSPDGQTVIRVIDAGGERERVEVNLGGRLPLYALDTPTLVTRQVVQLQRTINLALSSMGRNAVQAGFLERVITNAQLPGQFVEQPDGTRRFVADAFTVGPGTTNVLQGLATYDDEGIVRGFASPSISYRDPVSPATFVESADAAYRMVLQECDQQHTLISGDAAASGESRRQALADFASSLLPTKVAIEALGRWLCETLLAFAGAFTGQPERFAALRVNVACQLDLGPLPVAEIAAVSDLVAGQLLSRESGMVRVGVDDPTAEKQLIADEQDADAERRARLFSAGGPLDRGPEE